MLMGDKLNTSEVAYRMCNLACNTADQVIPDVVEEVTEGVAELKKISAGMKDHVKAAVKESNI
jgi:uncharacterized coiled-coil protein SlyX